MATQNKPAKRPQVVGPFQGVNPPEDVGAPPAEPPKPQANELTPSAETLKKVEEERKLDELRDVSGKAERASRRASMGTTNKAKGGYVKAADGCAQRGKTKGKYL